MRRMCALLLALAPVLAAADDRAEFNRRAAAADSAAFRQLDLNNDGRLTREEAKGDLNLGPRFEDIDINRDGVVTRDELERYLRQTYGATSS